MSDHELMQEALRRLPSHVLDRLTLRKLLQEKGEACRCLTAQQIREQILWERSCDAGR